MANNENKKGAIITAIMVGAVAIGVYLATIILNVDYGKKKNNKRVLDQTGFGPHFDVLFCVCVGPAL